MTLHNVDNWVSSNQLQTWVEQKTDLLWARGNCARRQPPDVTICSFLGLQPASPQLQILDLSASFSLKSQSINLSLPDFFPPSLHQSIYYPVICYLYNLSIYHSINVSSINLSFCLSSVYLSIIYESIILFSICLSSTNLSIILSIYPICIYVIY